jgi:hypothetical protein
MTSKNSCRNGIVQAATVLLVRRDGYLKSLRQRLYKRV